MDLEVAIDAFSRVLPVLLLVGLGALFRRTDFLSAGAIAFETLGMNQSASSWLEKVFTP